MDPRALADRIESWLKVLCEEVGNRHVGSEGNRRATDFLYDAFSVAGWDTRRMPFDCIDWEAGEARLEVDGQTYPAHVGPYSPACDVRAAVAAASTLDELQQRDVAGELLLIHGPLAAEQIMPKNFKFYQPLGHPELVALLERLKPAAIVAATGRNPGLAGGVYPFPMFEDGDFDIPTAYMKDVDGQQLLEQAGLSASGSGGEAHLSLVSRRIPSTGCNVLARKGEGGSTRIVVCAHVDAKKGTPGALDNAAGVCVLLALAELLNDHRDRPAVELLAFNGEDYYSAPGQIAYLNGHPAGLEDVLLAINIDGAGFIEGRSAFSFYQCPDRIIASMRAILSENDELMEGTEWYQGDHMIFVMQQRPAIAVTSEHALRICTDISHTPQDRPDLVAPAKLARIALALRDLIRQVI
jgi:aminopeptidase YwaD